MFLGSLAFAPNARHAPDYDATLADYLGLLDAHGVSHAVLVQPSFLGTDNDFLCAALRACPARLRGVAVVDPGVSPGHLQALDAAGVRGLRLNLVGLPLPELAQPAWQALFAQVRRLGWHVELHRESGDLPLVGQAVLDAGCRLVVDHFGRPRGDSSRDAGFGWLLRAVSAGRTWVKLSAAYRNWPDALGAEACAAARALLEAGGPERLLWGSDWPHTQHREQADYTRARTALDSWIPDADARRRILVDTPAALFGFSKEAMTT